MHSQDESQKPLIIAHRGDSANAPENTAASIRSAVAAKADLIEFDVRETSDGVLMVFHDKDLKRYTGAKTTFEALGFEEVRKLDVGSWFDAEKTFAEERPPTFEEAVRFCLEGETMPLIERKSGPAEAYLKVIRDLKAEDRVIVQAFDWEFLRQLRKLAPEIVIGALGDKKPDAKRVAELKELRPQWIGWNQKYLTESSIDTFHDLGAKVAVWTVNDLARIRLFAAWGADGLITDRPGEAREAVIGNR
ncbi:MAG: hypothetical protein KDN19_10965 [Verrucomicrobiae bacterium]|nr:hypothetical protein [Verrucomicrobiae bacterium]